MTDEFRGRVIWRGEDGYEAARWDLERAVRLAGSRAYIALYGEVRSAQEYANRAALLPELHRVYG